MPEVKIDNTAGLPTKYIEQEYEGQNARIYLLPGVPANAGRIDSEGDVDIEKVFSHLKTKIPDDTPEDTPERIRRLLTSYRGRVIDTASVIGYALEQGKFAEYGERLEEGFRDFDHIHPDMRMARTDMTAFFLQLYLDLGIAGPEAEGTIRFNEIYGPGLIVFPED